MKYADWLTKEEAAARLGVSERTVMRMADDKKIQQKLRPRPGGSPLAVFNPADVERVASERAAADARPFVMPADAGAVIPAAPGPMLPAALGTLVPAAELAELIGAAIAKGLAPMLAALPTPTEQPPDLLTTKEAVAMSSPAWLRARIKSGELKRVGRKISRAALIRLRDA